MRTFPVHEQTQDLHARNTGFKVVTDGTHVVCLICDQTIKRESISAHIKSVGHKKNTNVQEMANAELARVDAIQQAEAREREQVQFAQLEDLELRLKGTLGAQNQPKEPVISQDFSQAPSVQKSSEETQIWEDFIANGADFTMDMEGPDQAAKEHACLEEEIKTFGLWNAQRSAAELGFQIGTEAEDALGLDAAAAAEEDVFLVDLFTKNNRKIYYLSSAYSPNRNSRRA